MCFTKSALTVIATAVFLLATPAIAQTVATVNGKPIPQTKLDFIIKSRASQGQNDTPEARANLKEMLITREIVAQEAAKKGLDKDPDFALQLELAKQELLIQAYLRDYQKANPISDDVMKKEYDRIRTTQSDAKEYKARHILVATEQEAKSIVAQLKKGGKFEKLAEKSKDPGSKVKGGDLGWNVAANYVKPFADALTKLKKGQLLESPVQSQFGWHVIKLDDERPFQFPAFEDVKAEIQQSLQQQQHQQMISDLRAKSKIE